MYRYIKSARYVVRQYVDGDLNRQLYIRDTLKNVRVTNYRDARYQDEVEKQCEDMNRSYRLQQEHNKEPFCEKCGGEMDYDFCPSCGWRRQKD